jgi:hypothetical protein
MPPKDAAILGKDYLRLDIPGYQPHHRYLFAQVAC